MAVERAPGGNSLIDVLDRILDKGIVVEAWGRNSLSGIDLTTADTRIVVSSIDTHLQYGQGNGNASDETRAANGQRSESGSGAPVSGTHS
jgi:hypothetical protein